MARAKPPNIKRFAVVVMMSLNNPPITPALLTRLSNKSANFHCVSCVHLCSDLPSLNCRSRLVAFSVAVHRTTPLSLVSEFIPAHLSRLHFFAFSALYFFHRAFAPAFPALL